MLLKKEAFGIEDQNAIKNQIINHPPSLISTSFQLTSAGAANHKSQIINHKS